MRTRHLTFFLVIALGVAACQGESPQPAATESTAPSPAPAASAPPPSTSAPTTTSARAPETTTTTTSTPSPATTGSTEAVAATSESTELVTLDVAGRMRSYVLHVPAGLAEPAALVLDFHGLTADPNSQDRVSGMRVAAAEYGFVVAQPEAALVGNAWDTLEGSEDVSFALAVVADVATRASIDPARVYATGYSAGGGMAARLGCDAAETFAAIAVIAGAHIGHRRCAPTTPVPILAVYGDADIIVPYGGLGPLPEIEAWAGDWADRNGCPTQAAISSVAEDVTATRWGPCDRSVAVTLYTVAGGGHGWPGTPDPDRVGDTTESISATDLIWEFFTSHPRR